MASAQDIRELVLSYVSGEISASDFANRYAPVLKAAIKSRDNSAKDLALAVHAQVSHYFNGLISEDDFRSNLRPIGESAKRTLVSFSYQVVSLVEEIPDSSNPNYAAVVSPENFQTLVPTA